MQGFPLEVQKNLVEQLEQQLPGLQVIDRENFQLLGAAMFDDSVDSTLQDKVDTLSTMYERLPLMSSHAAVTLLQHSLGVQKVVYFLRTSPGFSCPTSCRDLDKAVIKALERCLNLSFSSSAAAQLQLPISKGGLGIRSAEALALPCFLSSSYGSIEMVRLCMNDLGAIPTGLREALEQWTTTVGPAIPMDSREFQKEWDNALGDTIMKRLLAEDTSDLTRARLTHVSQKESGLFLTAVPSPNVGTLLNNEQLRASLALRLGLPLYEKHPCACGRTVDTRGLHKLSCSQYALQRQARHDHVNDVLARALRQAGVTNRLEPQGLCADDAIRPDGVTIMPWSAGRALTWDVTIRDTYAATHLPYASRAVGHASSKAEREKRQKYLPLLNSYTFVPFAIESSGVWGGEAREFARQIGQRITQLTGEVKATQFLCQRISIEVARGTAALLMEGLPQGEDLHELFLT